MDGEEQRVMAANSAFYEAFADADIDAMGAVWAQSTPVACIHPGWQLIEGRDAVLASWKAIFDGGGERVAGTLRERVQVLGEAALVTCVEPLAGGVLMATNVFALEAGSWRMVLHQSGPISMAMDTSEPEDEGPPSGFLN